ncbi:MAG: hypothetical protein ABIR33_16590 [Pyrinomonadaceae bacterium]
MKSKLFAIFTLSVLVLNLAGSALADTKARKTANSAAIVAMLPASDGVVVFDIKTFLGSALPQMLSGNQTMLAEVTRAIEEAKTKTGIDVRQFETLAAGVTATKIKDKEYDLDSVLIARGQVSSGAILAAAKLAAKGKYREEKVGEKTLFIFDAREIAAQNAPQGTSTGIHSKILKAFSSEMAAFAVDANTLAFGSVAKVRATAEGTTKVDKELTDLLSKAVAPVATFVARVPAGMSAFLPLDNDELGKNIDSIKLMYGSMGVNGTATNLSATARTLQAGQAVSLKDTLDGLQMLGKMFLGNAKGADKEVYARLIENVKFSNKGNEVSMDLAIAQTDVDFLVGLLAKK